MAKFRSPNWPNWHCQTMAWIGVRVLLKTGLIEQISSCGRKWGLGVVVQRFDYNSWIWHPGSHWSLRGMVGWLNGWNEVYHHVDTRVLLYVHSVPLHGLQWRAIADSHIVFSGSSFFHELWTSIQSGFNHGYCLPVLEKDPRLKFLLCRFLASRHIQELQLENLMIWFKQYAIRTCLSKTK